MCMVPIPDPTLKIRYRVQQYPTPLGLRYQQNPNPTYKFPGTMITLSLTVDTFDSNTPAP